MFRRFSRNDGSILLRKVQKENGDEGRSTSHDEERQACTEGTMLRLWHNSQCYSGEQKRLALLKLLFWSTTAFSKTYCFSLMDGYPLSSVKTSGDWRICTLRQHIITTLCLLLRLPFALLDLLRRPFVRRAWQHPRSIVVIKPCCIGDLIMTTPLLEVIHQHYPDAHITYVAGSWSKTIAEHHPAVQAVIDCGSVGIPGKYSLSDYRKLARRLRNEHFDLAFVLDRSPMLTLLPWLAGIPRRVGPDSLGRGFSLTDRVAVSTSRTQLQHQADIYLDLARALSIPIDHPHMRFVPTAEEKASRRANNPPTRSRLYWRRQ